MKDSNWSDPPNMAVIVNRQIIRGDRWIALVSHDADDGGWQFHSSDPGPVSETDAAVVSISEMVQLDRVSQNWRTYRSAGMRGGRRQLHLGSAQRRINSAVVPWIVGLSPSYTARLPQDACERSMGESLSSTPRSSSARPTNSETNSRSNIHPAAAHENSPRR